MESKPRAWEGDVRIYSDDCWELSSGKLLVECDRRDVLLRWTEDCLEATHRTERGEIFRGVAELCEPLYIATPVADLVQSEAERAVDRLYEKTSKALCGVVWSDATAQALKSALAEAVELGKCASRNG